MKISPDIECIRIGHYDVTSYGSSIVVVGCTIDCRSRKWISSSDSNVSLKKKQLRSTRSVFSVFENRSSSRNDSLIIIMSNAEPTFFANFRAIEN